MCLTVKMHDSILKKDILVTEFQMVIIVLYKMVIVKLHYTKFLERLLQFSKITAMWQSQRNNTSFNQIRLQMAYIPMQNGHVLKSLSI